MHQDASLYAALLAPDQRVEHRFADGRHGWIQIARGAVDAKRRSRFRAGDGAAIGEQPAVSIRGMEDAEVLLFDLA